MKSILLPLILISSATWCQVLRVDPETKLFTLDRVEELDTMKAASIFAKTKEWMVLKSANISGEVAPTLLKGTMTGTCIAPFGGDMPCLFNVSVRIKTGAIKATVDNFQFIMTDQPPSPIEAQFIDPAAAIIKKKKAAVGVEAAGNEIVNELIKHLRTNSDF